jgi:hypothetical protein
MMTKEQNEELNTLVSRIENKIKKLQIRGILLKGLLEKVKVFSKIDDYTKCKEILEKIDRFLDELETLFQEIDVLLKKPKSFVQVKQW